MAPDNTGRRRLVSGEWLSGVMAVTSAVEGTAVIIFYATELDKPEPRVFGPDRRHRDRSPAVRHVTGSPTP